MSMISIRLNERDASLIKSYSRLQGISVSDFVRNTVIGKIEDEIDIQYFTRVTKTMRKSFTLDELENIVKGKTHV